MDRILNIYIGMEVLSSLEDSTVVGLQEMATPSKQPKNPKGSRLYLSAILASVTPNQTQNNPVGGDIAESVELQT